MALTADEKADAAKGKGKDKARGSAAYTSYLERDEAMPFPEVENRAEATAEEMA